MGILIVLAWIFLAAVFAAVIGFSQIFKMGQGIRVVWAGMITVGLILLLISGVESAWQKAKIPSPTETQSRETFIEQAIQDKPWMKSSDFN